MRSALAWGRSDAATEAGLFVESGAWLTGWTGVGDPKAEGPWPRWLHAMTKSTSGRTLEVAVDVCTLNAHLYSPR